MTIGEMHDLLTQLVDDGYASSKGYIIRSIRDTGEYIRVVMVNADGDQVYVRYTMVKTVVTSFKHVMNNY